MVVSGLQSVWGMFSAKSSTFEHRGHFTINAVCFLNLVQCQNKNKCNSSPKNENLATKLYLHFFWCVVATV